MDKRWKLEKPLAVITSIALVFSLTVAPGVASARTAADGLTTGKVAPDIPEWAVDDGGEAPLATQAALPAKYDLRDTGVVTPVKLQNPWGSCWAFGGTAAAETSILSTLGKTYEETKLDLSERHLTYFALQPVTESVDPTQVGEGIHTLNTTDPNAAFDAGGAPIFVTTLFSQGVGPVAESLFPYRGVDAQGKSNFRDLAYFDADPEKATRAQLASELGGQDKVDVFLANQASTLSEQTGREITVQQVLGYYEDVVRAMFVNGGAYSKEDDWSIPELDSAGEPNRLVTSGMVLKDGSVLPEYWNGDRTQLNAASQAAIKQEIAAGRGVTIMFYADQTGTYTMGTPDDPLGKWYNQYVSDTTHPADHGVCIVGWDDSYSAKNFKTEAPGDGAWIVKNSWGSAADKVTDDLGNVTGGGAYGIKNAEGEYTGYFYLSYYDKMIGQPESMTFSSNLAGSDGFYTLQHDYMPAFGGFYTTDATTDVVSSANIFGSDEADATVAVKSVSTRTPEANMRVTFAIYRLADTAKDPTDGTMVYRQSETFEYSGFHRLDLDLPVLIEPGQTFSIVSTVSKAGADGARTYSVSANQGVSKAYAEYYIEQGANMRAYNEAVVNKGESYLYRNSERAWVDWGDYIAALPKMEDGTPGERYIDQCPIDNFSIKAYAAPVTAAEADELRLREAKARVDSVEDAANAADELERAKAQIKTDIAAAKVTVGKAVYNGGKAVKPKVTVKLGDVTLKSGADYKLTFANNKKAGDAVVVVKGAGSYDGAAVKTFPIAKADNPLAAKAASKTIAVSYGSPATKAKAFRLSGAKGAVTFAKVSGNSKISVSKAGKISVKRTLKPGTYTLKVNVKAAGDNNYNPSTKPVTLKIKV